MSAPIVLGSTEDGDLILDLAELLTSGAFIQGNSGSGKSGLIRRILEETHGRVQQIVLDAEGDYVTLSQGYAYVLCGEGFPVPAQVESAGRLALKLYETGVSAVVDISNLELQDQQRYLRLFVEALMLHAGRLKPEERHHALVVIDELQLFAPQQSDAESTAVMIDLGHRGRRRGLHPILATQRLSGVSKDAVSEIPNKLFGRTTLDVDQKRVAQELGLDVPTRRQLGRLQQRQFYAYGPALSQEPVIFTVADVQTRMPKIGELSSFTPPPPSEEVLAALAALTEVEEEPIKQNDAGLPPAETVAHYAPDYACNHEDELEHLAYTNRALTGDINQLEAEVTQLKSQLLVKGVVERDSAWEDSLAELHQQINVLTREKAEAEQAAGDYQVQLSVLQHDLLELPGIVEKAVLQLLGREDNPPRHVNIPVPAAQPAVNPPQLRQDDGQPAEGTSNAGRGSTRTSQRNEPAGAGTKTGRDTEDMKDAEVEALIRQLLRESNRVLVVPPAEVIRKDYLGKAIDRLMAPLVELAADEREALRVLSAQPGRITMNRLCVLISGNDSSTSRTRWGKALEALRTAGLVESATNGFKADDAALRARIVKALEPHNATASEVEDVYQAVLGRIAGEGVLA